MAFGFENLEVYRNALELGKDVFKITSSLKRGREYLCLLDQANRAALSVSLNIAEGSGRTKKQFCHFLDIARCSIFECIPIFEIMLAENILSQENFNELYNRCEVLAKRINALKNSLKQ